MITSEKRTPEAELEALKDLVASDGWQVLQEHLAQAWGPEAYERAIDGALAKDHDPSDEIAITRRIRDTFKGVRAEAAWVTTRIGELQAAVKRKHAPSVDPFAHVRRVVRRG